jgi:hypothetical protein
MIKILKGTLMLLFNHFNHGVNCLQELVSKRFKHIIEHYAKFSCSTMNANSKYFCK